MKFYIAFALVAFCAMPPSAFAEGSASGATPVAASAPATTTPTVPAPVVTPVPPGTPSGPAVAVAEPAAPPTWAQDLIVTAQGLPVIGPIVAKLLVYIGILSSILTTLVGALLAVINTLMGVFNLAGLVSASTWLAGFRDGKIMYWLRFFSLFNAKKDPASPDVIK